METVTLNNGMQMPVLGFGTYQIESVNTKKAVKQAINAGYRLIDTAQYYGNEAGVGQAVKESGISRDQFLKMGKETRSFKDVMNCPNFLSFRSHG